MAYFTQEEFSQLLWWLEVIIKAPHEEFIDRYIELEDIVPMAILDRALSQLNPVIKSRFDKLTDFTLRGENADNN